MTAGTGIGDRSLRGAMLGTGSIAVHHMRAWGEIPGVEIVALANRTRERAVSLGRDFGIAEDHIHADYRELLEREEIDFVDIATAPELHREQVLAAAAQGVHVQPAHAGCSPAEAYQDSYRSAQAHFIHCLRTGEAAETEARDNLKTLAATLAAYSSAEGGTIVDVIP